MSFIVQFFLESIKVKHGGQDDLQNFLQLLDSLSFYL